MHGKLNSKWSTLISDFQIISEKLNKEIINRKLSENTFKLISSFSSGNKNGNKRTANIRSVGYTDLFVLSKEDLWEVLTEYPEAKQKLIERGRQQLQKDNLIDEELEKLHNLQQLSSEEKLENLERSMDAMLTELHALTEKFNSVQLSLKQQITSAEIELSRIEAGVTDDDDW